MSAPNQSCLADGGLQLPLFTDSQTTMPVAKSVYFANEHDLIAAAMALIGVRSPLSAAEQAIAKSITPARSQALLTAVSDELRAGHDPLGERLTEIRDSRDRRRVGAFYTPDVIVRPMVDWAAAEGEPCRIIDPGAGSGRFLMYAAARFPRAQLLAIEVDPVAALVLRANLATLGLTDRTRIIVGDYRAAEIPRCQTGYSLFIGNPPYVRHHGISGSWKEWYATTTRTFGVPASKLAGLHLHFFVRTLQLARPGDIGALITSAEWLDVNYGHTLRKLLLHQLGGISLHVLDTASMPFGRTMVTGAITCFRVGSRPTSMRVAMVPSVRELRSLRQGIRVPHQTLARARRWSTIIKPAVVRPPGFIELGELCRVHRGQVTGANSVWISGDHSALLPRRVLKPAVTKAREIIAANGILTSTRTLRKVIDLPSELDEFVGEERQRVDSFLRWARSRGAADSYIARHRRAWWAVNLYDPAPIVCTYMGRRPPEFARNVCSARHINIAHGLYPREKLSSEEIAALVQYLRRAVNPLSGRIYAGGLVKFEPKELERIPIPPLRQLMHEGPSQMGSHSAIQ